MVEWLTVLSLLVFGLALIIAEIIFVPGTTVVGIIGFVFLVLGTGLSFFYFGRTAGWMTTGGTGVASAVLLYYAFKANVWGHFSLKSTNTGKVNEGELEALTVGAEGVALSALRPIGKAEFGEKTYEVKTLGNYVETGKKIRITQIRSNQIIVEPLK